MANTPPWCPSRACESARSPDPAWFTNRGTFPRADGRVVRRYQCKSCGRHFSEQTFRPDYRQKLPRINTPLRALLAAGTSLRAAARLLGVDRKTVLRRAAPAAVPVARPRQPLQSTGRAGGRRNVARSR